MGADRPELDSAEFRAATSSPRSSTVRQRSRGGDSFTWSRVPQALSLLFLEYLCASLEGRGESFCFPGARTGSLAASLGDAFGKEGFIRELFAEWTTEGVEERHAAVLGGRNLHGKEDNERRFVVNSDYLPPDCVEVFWQGERLDTPEKLRALAELIRKNCGLEPSRQPAAPRTEAKVKPPAVEPPAAPPVSPHQPEPPLPKKGTLSGWLAGEIGDAVAVLRRLAKPDPVPPSPLPAPEAQTPPETKNPPTRNPFARFEHVEKMFPPIDPALFTVPDTNLAWPDDLPLIQFPGEEADYTWSLKQAFEGILILGRTGSGKTTGSGVAFAEAFLRSGFGGLVLTVKENEAEHWRGLCAHCGREKDLVIVQRGGDAKLNLLAYEAQHPSQGTGLSENLTAFCRNLLNLSVRSKGGGMNEQLWESAGNQLLNATFDLFLLARETITFDRLADFVAAAPAERLPESEADWLKLPVFGPVLIAAQQRLTTDEDRRLFQRATGYWFTVYAKLAGKTRSSVTLGIYAMFDAFRGRDIPALVAAETNVTPECTMAGKIVVLDLPLKVLRHTGLLVQGAWKYLFQIALERQARANHPRCRPVFLWEDEAQYFFSEHDHHFQDTARSSRVARVVLTQNLHGFYKELGRDGEAAANAVFGNLNTKVFHNNSDPLTNEWAAKHFGMELRTRHSFNVGPTPQPQDLFGSLRQALDPPNTVSVGGAEHWEYAVRPEEFNQLRTGGPEHDFAVDAVITWLGLSDENGRHFLLTTFLQNQTL